MFSKRVALRAVPALMLMLFIAACSRAPEEPETAEASGTELVVIAAADPILFAPEQAPDADRAQGPFVLRFASESTVEDEKEFVNEDPSDKPNNDLAENPNDDPSGSESPHPSRNSSTSSVGIGGGIGGGAGRSGKGGFAYRRARGGGGRPHDDHNRAALEWLKDHQHADGHWSADEFSKDTVRSGASRTGKDDGGWTGNDVFVTSMAVLAFVGAGYDHKEGDYRATCRAAILYLRGLQEKDGSFPDSTAGFPLVTSACATAALAEAYGLSGDAAIKTIADNGVSYLVSRQLPGSGWGDGDANLLDTTWAVFALKSASTAGLTFDFAARARDAAKFLKQMQGVDKDGRRFATYSALAEQVPLLTAANGRADLPRAEALWAAGALLSGAATASSVEVTDFLDRITASGNLPEWKAGALDFQYWYWGSYAAFQAGGKAWATWEKGLSAALVDNQRGFVGDDKGKTATNLDEHGSWDPVDVWGTAGGRVYATAINALNLQIYSRYQRAETPKNDSDKDAIEDAEEFAKAQAFVPDDGCGGLRARSGGVVLGDFPLARTVVSAKVSGNVAGTTVTQTFTNPYTKPIEAMYTFPLPVDSAINDFAMRIGNRRIVGVIRPREEALTIYKEARARGQTASLLTQNRPNVFTQSVANIEVGGEVKVTFTYYQSLKYEDGRYEYVFPLTLGERYKGGVADPVTLEPIPAPTPEPEPEPRDGDGVDDPEDFDVRTLPQGQRSGMDIELTVDIDAGMPIDVTRLRSMQHEILVNMTSQGRALVELSRKDAIPNRDFVLRWGIAGDKPAVALHTHSDSRGNYLSLQVQPQLDPRDADITPREITFILDNSGSMSGAPAQMSRKIISQTLDHLQAADTFNIVYFAGSNGQVFERPAANTVENVETARSFLRDSSAGGGTEMLAGLKRALKAEHDPRHLQMYAFLTDGQIGGEKEVLKTIQEQGQDARFFAFGTGSSVNRYLIDGIAEHGKGKAIYCLPRDGNYDDAAVQEFFDAIDRPVLCDIEIDWNGLQVDEAYPGKFTDLFASRPLSLMARYSGEGKHTIHVRGRVGPRHVSYPIELDLSAPDTNPAIATIWARHKIAELEARLLVIPGDRGMQEAILQTALDYRLMSAYTSFVAVDESRVVSDGQPLRVWQPVEMPENVLYAGQDVAAGDQTYRIGSWGLVVGQTSDGRVIVVKVEDGSAAAEAGMKPGQILNRINGTKVADLAKLEKVLLQSEAKVDVETSVTDDGKQVEATFKLPQAAAEKTK